MFRAQTSTPEVLPYSLANINKKILLNKIKEINEVGSRDRKYEVASPVVEARGADRSKVNQSYQHNYENRSVDKTNNTSNIKDYSRSNRV